MMITKTWGQEFGREQTANSRWIKKKKKAEKHSHSKTEAIYHLPKKKSTQYNGF